MNPYLPFRFLFLLPLIALPLCAQDSEQPPSGDEIEALIVAGVELRHQGDMEAAMAKYMEALDRDPDNVKALYEVCYSYFQLGEYEKSLEFGERGAQFRSGLQGQFYAVIGNCRDILREPEKAIEAYEKGIDLTPDAPMIRYNLALTYANTGNLTEAEETVKEELLINPEHASSHFLLAILYGNRKERIPALLATARFLVLEPNGSRSPNALRSVETLLTDGIKKSKNPGEGEADINVLFDMSESKEGAFTSVELMLTMATVSTAIDSVPKSEYESMKEVLDLTFGMIGEQGASKKMGKGFAAEYYVPYFAELHRQGYLDALISLIMMSHDDPEAQAWLNEPENKKKVEELIVWSEEFEWKGR